MKCDKRGTIEITREELAELKEWLLPIANEPPGLQVTKEGSDGKEADKASS